MGVNTDGKEMGPGSTVTDGVKLTAEACVVVKETGNEKSLPQDVDGDVGIQDQKPAKGTGIPLIPFPKVPLQSSVLNIEHKEADREHADEGDSVLFNTTTALQSDADIEDGNSGLSHGAHVSLDTDASADDKCVLMEECTSPLQPAEIMEILESEENDDWDAMYNTLLDEISPSDVSAFKQELTFNLDIDQMNEEGYTPLYKAALEGHLEGVDDLISRGANPNKPSEGGLRPLHAAAQEGHTHIVDFLILQGADVGVECDLGQTPLHTAAAKGFVDILKSFIAEGPDLNKENNTGWTPFNAAVQNGHLDAVKYLMSEGVKQNRYAGRTPLYAAAFLGHLGIVKFFISNGADVNEELDDGRIPLHGAVTRGHIKVMEYLVQQGSYVNKKDKSGWLPLNAAVQYGHLLAVKYIWNMTVIESTYNGITPLYCAARFGHVNVVKFLISKGGNVKEGDCIGQIPLHGAAINGDIEIIQYLIHQGCDVNKKDDTGMTPLNVAVQHGHLEAVKYIMTEGAKLNRNDGITPLYVAAKFGHLHIVEFLISKGADVNQEDDLGKIALHAAATRGHIQVLEYLIQQGSDVNKGDAEGWTPFNAAVQYGQLEAITCLITKGAKRNRYDGMTPLFSASRFGHLDIVKFLVSKGADVNEEHDKGMIPLHGAAIRGHLKVMEYLIQQGSDVNKGDAEGWTPFNAAVQNGHLDAVKYLMYEGVKQNRYAGRTPLFSASRFGHLDIFEFFIGEGAYVKEEDDKGMIPIHGAAAHGQSKVMEYLIQQGSDVNQKNHIGWTPLHAAVSNGHLEVVKVLSEKRAQGTRFEGLTPLYIATQYDHIDVVKFLVSGGYDVNDRNEDGKSPLHAASYNGNIDIMKFLVHHNANVNEQDHDGWTPLYAAAQRGHQDIVDYLTLNGADVNLNDIDDLTPLKAATYTGHPRVITGISSRGDDPGEGETGDPRPGGNHNLLTRVYITASLKDTGTQSRTGKLTSQVDNSDERNDCSQADNAKRGAGGLSLQNLSTRIHDGNKDVAHSNVNEHLYPRRGDPNEDDTWRPLSGDHHNGAKHLATRGGAKQKKKVVEMKETDTQSRTRQLTPKVDNADDTNGCTQADDAKRVADELSLKNLPTRIHGDDKGGNGEHNPFSHAKLKYPDKGEQDPMLDQMEVIRCTGTRKRDTITNGTDCFSLRGSQTWQYSGFDPPNLQTMETGGHPSEEPESRVHSLVDEDREKRESPSPMNADNNLPINETLMKFESFSTHPQLYDGNSVTSKGTPSNPLRKIATKRRTSVDRCPSILTLVQTFLQMIIALAIILAGSPALVAGSDSIERVTLQAGEPGMVPFHLPLSPIGTPRTVPYYTLRFESQPRPFCINGEADIKGFKNPSQLRRFTTSVTDLDTSPCVNLIIDNVDSLDEDGYLLTAVWHSFENVRYEIMKKEIDVQYPPGPAKCFITLSENDDYPYEVHCRATTGSVTTTLSCYQNDRKIDVRGDITDNGLITRGIFWLPDDTHFSCCSHDVTSHENETTCNDFVWPPDMHDKETTSQTANAVPTLVTNNITRPAHVHTATTRMTYIEYQIGSGTLRSAWPFACLLIPMAILIMITMYNKPGKKVKFCFNLNKLYTKH